MFFSDVIGQQAVKEHLVKMVNQNHVSHALLFLGAEGSGALPLALAFSQFIACQSLHAKESAEGSLFDRPSEPGFPANESCGKCAACIKAQQLIHPDIHFSYPVVPRKAGDKPISTDYIQEWRQFISGNPYGNLYDWLQFIGAENKQGNITANECNDILHKLSLKSFEGEYKILVMWMPEYLGNEGNKLLKLLEEPPSNTLFILVAESESLILPTILSRTQLVKIPALQAAEVEEMLIKQNIEASQARQAAVLSEGNFREALQLLKHSAADWQSHLREWLNAVLKTGPVAQVKWIEDISKTGRENQKQFLRYFNHLLELAVRIRIIGEEKLNLPEKEKDFAIRLNNIAGIEQQEAIIQELDKAVYYIERNANAKLLFHALTIRLYHIMSEQTVIDIH